MVTVVMGIGAVVSEYDDCHDIVTMVMRWGRYCGGGATILMRW